MSFLAPGLTPEEASVICIEQCRAMCCRGPLILTLAENEVEGFQERARALGADAKLTVNENGGWVRFADHPGECCPMLDQTTWRCRIYDHRPQRCRAFPERLTPGCAISGG